VDSAVGVALSKEQGTKKVTKIFLGADALLKKGVVNKIGSGTIAKLAKIENIPVYIIADSWKYSNKNIKLEKRKIKEVWNKIRKSKNFSIENPAFELILKKYISGIFTELGFMTYSKFLKEMKK